MNELYDDGYRMDTADLILYASAHGDTALEKALAIRLEELMQRVEELEEERQILLGRPGII